MIKTWISFVIYGNFLSLRVGFRVAVTRIVPNHSAFRQRNNVHSQSSVRFRERNCAFEIVA
jgi:hypothetical protein